MNKPLIFILLLSILFGCSAREITVKISTDEKLKQSNLAVLDFDITGQYKNRKLSGEIADILTETLYHEGYKKVVDRSRVKELQKKLKIKTGAILTKDQIRSFKSELNAEYLLLGTLSKSNTKFGDDASKLSFRVVSTQNFQIVSFASVIVLPTGEERNPLWKYLEIIADDWVDSID